MLVHLHNTYIMFLEDQFPLANIIWCLGSVMSFLVNIDAIETKINEPTHIFFKYQGKYAEQN